MSLVRDPPVLKIGEELWKVGVMMSIKKLSHKTVIILLLPLGIALVLFSSGNPILIESFYSGKLYPPIGKMLSITTGIFPFSLAEIIVILAPIAFLVYTAAVLVKTFYSRSFKIAVLVNYITNIFVIISITAFTFLGVWGLNYYRMPFSSIAGLEVRPASVEELESLCRTLIERANELRSSVTVNEEGHVDIPGNARDILRNCYKGYDGLADRYRSLYGKYGDPKPILLSELMNYTGICGVYFPFTGEANVNVAIPESTLPSTASHEMAHQRGFSREDEANYISYLACTAHPDVNYKYSGVLLALINSMNALYKSDSAIYSRLSDSYSEDVRNDLEQINEFWKKYEGPVEKTSSRINNTYLKANNQKDGVKSYGRMVDLLIAEHRLSDK